MIGFCQSVRAYHAPWVVTSNVDADYKPLQFTHISVALYRACLGRTPILHYAVMSLARPRLPRDKHGGDLETQRCG